MLSDCHMHTAFSPDSEADPELMIKSAVEKGLDVLCFTDHEDKDNMIEGPEFVIDTDQYFITMKELQEKYKKQIDIRIGVEIGLLPHLGEFYKEYTRKYPFDFVIGSVHLVDNMDPYYPELFQGKTDREVYERTFIQTIEDIDSINDYDTLGHLDYVVRYGKNKEKEYSYQEFSDYIDEILKRLIERGKGLEFNTAGLKYGLPFAHPHPDVLKRYRELGGEIITVGSDAHKPEHIAYDFDQGINILKDCGFKYYTEFKNRQKIFKKL